MRGRAAVVLACLVSQGVLACGQGGSDGPVEAGDPVTRAGSVRFSLPTPHRVVVERRTGGTWQAPEVVYEDAGRECGAVRAVAAGDVVAATIACDDHFAEDQAPTRSVALIRADGETWRHHDLDGEAYSTPALSPSGRYAAWVQDGGLLRWAGSAFEDAADPEAGAQVLAVDDEGGLAGFSPGRAGKRCTVVVRSDGAEADIPVASADDLLCVEVGLSARSPTQVEGDVSGQPGTGFVLGRSGDGSWELTEPPPLAAPGLDRYPDAPSRAIWNQLTENTSGDLVAMGSPDRQHITVQRYDARHHRWSRSRVVHDAGAPVCHRSNLDSGVIQGATFELRLVCAGDPVVFRSRTGASWSR